MGGRKSQALSCMQISGSNSCTTLNFMWVPPHRAGMESSEGAGRQENQDGRSTPRICVSILNGSKQRRTMNIY